MKSDLPVSKRHRSDRSYERPTRWYRQTRSEIGAAHRAANSPSNALTTKLPASVDADARGEGNSSIHSPNGPEEPVRGLERPTHPGAGISGPPDEWITSEG